MANSSIDPMGRLSAALSDRYTIRNVLGRGGMATVYLADDVKHERQVAIKVLRPELAAALGTERFLREIKIAAQLRHPHILPLYDSGEVEELLYYVMPFVPGESLRDRLSHERQLPVEDAVRITRQVADALSFAHSQGIVHRDVKPENILLEAGHAVVADFGIARAITAAGGDRLTETGLVIGTPAYISPEQAGGAAELDGRSDLYSLGCVLYEMLAGEPPFTGPGGESVVHQHLTVEPRSVTDLRPTVPEHVAQALRRTLAKIPADRFASADGLASALGGDVLHQGVRPATAARPRSLWLTAAAVALLVVVALLVLRTRPAPSVDPEVVAVLPFRVVSADPSLQHYREGMVDLFAAKLTGEGGPRAVDPRTAIGAWQRAGGSVSDDLTEDRSIEVGESVGAGQILLGSMVGTEQNIELQARLVAVPSGETRGQAQVQGSPDSVLWLVDQLASQLLVRHAGEAEQRLVQLTSTSLQALRAYLDAQAAYRRGQYREAAGRFDRALDLDSTFALAALGLVAARFWTTSNYDSRGVRLGWQYRDRLSVRDRALMEALAGPEFPEPATAREHMDGYARATELAPDRPEPWYWLGESYFHYGRAMAIPAASARARDVFSRALSLDSSFLAPVEHLVDLAAEEGDAAAVERFAAYYLRVDSTGDMADFVRWRRAVAAGDSAWLATFRGDLEAVPTPSLRAVAAQSVLTAATLDIADQIVEVLARRADTPSERVQNILRMRAVALNRGRPAQVLELMGLLTELEPSPTVTPVFELLDGLFGGGDSAATVAAASELHQMLSDSATERAAQCAYELWRASEGRFDTAPQTLAQLRAASLPRDRAVATADRNLLGVSRICAATLDALIAEHEDRPDAPQALARLDSLMRQGPEALPPFVYAAHFTLARLHESNGNVEPALAAMRRIPRILDLYESSRLREVGRLAERLGDRAAAISAYQRYLTLRSDPEPAVAPEVEQVRQELARLIAERGSE